MMKKRQWQIAEEAPLLVFLLAQFPKLGRNKVKGLLLHRLVTVDGRVVTRHDTVLQSGQTLVVNTGESSDADKLHGLHILYEDEDVIVIDKPAGLLSMAGGEERERTAYQALMHHVSQQRANARVFIVHRLDRDTSGVMMFAKRESVQQALQQAWKDVVVERVYVALVEGQVSQREGKLTSWLKESNTLTMYVAKPGEGQKAVLRYKVMQLGPMYTLLEVRLDTGRKNQIRVQMQQMGHSVVGDRRYGARHNPLNRLGLHAHVLSFRHPTTGQVMRFEAPVPTGFSRLVKASGKPRQ